MSVRPQTSARDLLQPPAFDGEALTTPAASLQLRDEPHEDTVRYVPATSSPSPIEQTRRTLRDIAAERIDEASHIFFACALLVVTAGGIALSSTAGPRWLSVLAIAMVAVAAGIITVVRLRLRRELEVVARAQGLDADTARRETAALLRRALQLD